MYKNDSIESYGKCSYCNQEIPGSNVLDHINKCRLYKNARFQAGRKKPESMDYIFILQVIDLINPNYWLVLEINAKSRLLELDFYLKKIWYECCDSHHAWFHKGLSDEHLFYLSHGLRTAFKSTDEIFYSYDQENTSKAKIVLLQTRRGNQSGKNPILLLARNNPFIPECDICHEKADWLVFDENNHCQNVCDSHKNDINNPQRLAKIYNSPRNGICKYDGPAKSPY